MTDYTGDARLRDLLAPLSRIEPVPFGSAPVRRRPARRPVLVAAVAAAALALAGVAIADGFGAFEDISAAQHSQTSFDVLNPQTAAFFEKFGCGAGGTGSDGSFVPYSCEPASSRLISTLPNGDKLYVLQDTAGQLCVYLQGSGLSLCGDNGLDRQHPVLNVAEDQNGDALLAGVAMDGVTSVSFTLAGGKAVTVPVQDNAWVYEAQGIPTTEHVPFVTCVTAHFADGSTLAPGC
jgi:hypothetical protein